MLRCEEFVPQSFEAALSHSDNCPFCGERAVREISEIYSGGDFELDTCCEGMRDSFSEEVCDQGVDTRVVMSEMDLEGLSGMTLRRVASEEGRLLLDWMPDIRPISRKEARAFILAHHEHCPPPAGDRYRAAIWNGLTLMGVVMVGRPVARLLPQDRWVEVNRLCIRRDVPDALRWNLCSQLYGWAAREAKRRGFERIITYTLETEPATTLKAAGWTFDGISGKAGATWSRPSRPRTQKTPAVPKKRWFRDLSRPRRVSPNTLETSK